jgi:hypothetical protein
MVIARILGWILIAVALLVAGLALALWLGNQNFSLVVGQIWYQLDQGSLTFAQTLLQRRLHPALWDYMLLPLLQKPAYEAVPIAFLVPFLLGLVLLVAFRKRDRRRRFS